MRTKIPDKDQMPPEKKMPRLKFVHLFLAAAFLMVLANFIIAGLAPDFIILIPAFPFCLLAVLPVSRQFVGQADTQGIIGAGIGALIAVLPGTALFAYDMLTGWRGGADIGLGLLYIFLPLYSAILMALGYFIGEMIVLIGHRNFQRMPDMFKTLSLFAGFGLGVYFLVKSHSSYSLWRYYEINDPSAAELYEIDFWLYVLLAAASMLVPLGVYFIWRRDKKRSVRKIPTAKANNRE